MVLDKSPAMKVHLSEPGQWEGEGLDGEHLNPGWVVEPTSVFQWQEAGRSSCFESPAKKFSCQDRHDFAFKII
jgi:hypothetical protein